MDPGVLRALERILDSAIGGLSIYLGYRLFFKLPDKTDSQGKFILPGNISIYLSRVGPGVFFALFGAAVIALSLHNAIDYRTNGSADLAADAAAVKSRYIGVNPEQRQDNQQELENRRFEISRHLYRLNRIPGLLRSDLSFEQASDIEVGLIDLKLDLIESVWDGKWGNYKKFAEWAKLGAGGDLPEGISEDAAKLYSRGLAK